MTTSTPTTCACGAPARVRGACRSCATKARFAGRARTTSPCTYKTAHHRIRDRRGRAVDQTCPCGQPARQWAYQHAAGDREQHGTVDVAGKLFEVVWSGDPDDYAAMCRDCHTALDTEQRAPGTGFRRLIAAVAARPTAATTRILAAELADAGVYRDTKSAGRAIRYHAARGRLRVADDRRVLLGTAVA